MRASRAMVRHADMQSARALRLGAILTTLSSICGAAGATSGSVTLVTSFSVPKSPSGMFYQASSDVLWVLCGTETNGNHYLYAYSTSGTQKCLATIPQSVGMSRVDGFYIVDSKAYIVDSQGPIYASTSGKLGGSVYEVDWTNPCGCAAGSCTTKTVRPSRTRRPAPELGVVCQAKQVRPCRSRGRRLSRESGGAIHMHA